MRRLPIGTMVLTLGLALSFLTSVEGSSEGRRRHKRKRAKISSTTKTTNLEPTRELIAPVAWLFIKEKRYDEAIKLFNELLVEKPELRELHEGRIAACLRSPSCEKNRIPWLTEAIKRFPVDEEFLSELREQRLRSGQLKEAEAEVREQVKNNPSNVEARTILIDTLDERGDLYERARQLRALSRTLTHALKERPNDPDVWVRYGHYRLAILDLTGAANATRRALELTANNHPPARDLAALIADTQRERQESFEREVDRRDLAQDFGWARAD